MKALTVPERFDALLKGFIIESESHEYMYKYENEEYFMTRIGMNDWTRSHHLFTVIDPRFNFILHQIERYELVKPKRGDWVRYKANGYEFPISSYNKNTEKYQVNDIDYSLEKLHEYYTIIPSGEEFGK